MARRRHHVSQPARRGSRHSSTPFEFRATAVGRRTKSARRAAPGGAPQPPPAVPPDPRGAGRSTPPGSPGGPAGDGSRPLSVYEKEEEGEGEEERVGLPAPPTPGHRGASPPWETPRRSRRRRNDPPADARRASQGGGERTSSVSLRRSLRGRGRRNGEAREGPPAPPPPRLAPGENSPASPRPIGRGHSTSPSGE